MGKTKTNLILNKMMSSNSIRRNLTEHFNKYCLRIADRYFPAGTIERERLYLFVCYLRRYGSLLRPRRDVDNLLEKNFMPFSFPKIDRPEVSIVIAVYNNIIYTYNCLKSIMKETKGVRYEVIIVDNASTDETVNLTNILTNILVIRNEKTMGFVSAYNTGANKARGKYILFLNNNTKVTDGWLTAMVNVAERDCNVGAVGAKLIYPDGNLQEAGGIVWNDEQHIAWNYGRNQDPDNYEYNYLKEVDYCSGACLMVRKDIFEAIGGFDNRFLPAYCEDTDLAFAVRKLGYRVIYQPKAEIIHFEGKTAGTDTSKGMKRYQVTNHKKFYQKWKGVIEKEHFKTGENVLLARDRARGKKVMVYIEYAVPSHDRDAGSLTTYMYLKLFLELGLKVIFVPHNYYRYEPYTTDLQQMGIEVMYGFVNFKKWIRQNGKNVHYVLLARPQVSINYIDDVRRYTKAKVLYYMHDLHYVRELRRYEIEKDESILKEAESWKDMEYQVLRNVDTILSVSGKEAEIVRELFPEKEIRIMPVFFYEDVPGVKAGTNPFEKRENIVFLGGFRHMPNVDAVEHFIERIFPYIKKTLPGVKFYVVGSEPPEKITNLSSEDIIVTGHVKDLTPYFENCRVFVAPIRYGAGLKGKIVTSMSYGVPVVTTSIGNEGSNLIDGQHCIVADNEEEFAASVIALYTDKILWQRLSQNSIKFVKTNFSKDRSMELFLKILS